MNTLGLRAHAPIVDTDSDAEETPFDHLSRSLNWLGLGISLGMWAVVGFLLWIPLLVRATLTFALSSVNATLTTQTAERAGMVLKDAINFYRRGFVVAIDAIQGNGKTEPDDVPLERSATPSTTLNQVVWVVLSWYFMLLTLGVVETSPLDLWRSVAAVPWLEMLNVTADGFNAWVSETLPRLKGGS